MLVMKKILVDGRWEGNHGIGRFSHEILSRLKNCEILREGPKPLSLNNLVWLPHYLRKNQRKYKLYFNPGFNPILFSSIPYIFTLHDLTHLYVPGKHAFIKKMYYDFFTKPSAKRALKIITVSDYSKKNIIEWANIPEEKIVVVGNGISSCFGMKGNIHQPGYPYFLHVGNTKPHKNVARLVQAFASAKIDSEMRLILTGNMTEELEKIIHDKKLEKRIVLSGTLSDEKLAEYYRGARAFLFPSLYEGFGIPVIEAMACGTPVLTSNTTSLPEVAGDAAVLVDPNQVESISAGIEKISYDETLRATLIAKGLERIKLFSWEKTARKVQEVLDS
jgi:glycosyltransferase involved in cell wall biosynthesis